MKAPDVALSGQFHAPIVLSLGKELSVPNENEVGWDSEPVMTQPRSMMYLTITEKLTDKQTSKNDFIQANQRSSLSLFSCSQFSVFPCIVLEGL